MQVCSLRSNGMQEYVVILPCPEITVLAVFTLNLTEIECEYPNLSCLDYMIELCCDLVGVLFCPLVPGHSSGCGGANGGW